MNESTELERTGNKRCEVQAKETCKLAENTLLLLLLGVRDREVLRVSDEKNGLKSQWTVGDVRSTIDN